LGPAQNLNYLEMVTHSGPVVTFVLALLVIASLGSWTIIFRKLLHLRKAREQSARFLETFWRSKRLDQIYKAATSCRCRPSRRSFARGTSSCPR